MRLILLLLSCLILLPVHAQEETFADFEFKEPQMVMPDEQNQQAAPIQLIQQPMLITPEALQAMLQNQKDNKYEQWAQVVREQSSNQLKIVIILCAVSLLSLFAMLYVLRNRDSRDIVSGIGLNLIIFGTVIMVMIAETDQQLTAGAGILGAVAGYLFRSIQNEGGDTGQYPSEKYPPKH